MMTSPENKQSGKRSPRFLLWVDGVGAYLLCLDERITIGGPADPNQQSDVTLLANLSRKHVSLQRSGEGYVLEPHGPTSLGNRSVFEPTPLADGYSIRLGTNVSLKFRLTSVLSATAVLEFESDHRPVYSVDGVIMMEENCLLGPGGDQHVRCANWSEAVVLFRRDHHFWCKSRKPITIDGKPSSAGGPIAPGDVVSSGSEVRFRLEEIL